jgi:hypothetical protein
MSSASMLPSGCRNAGSWNVRFAELTAVCEHKEQPYTQPNPSGEVVEILPDGVEFKVVWSLLRSSGVAKLVTVHFFDEEFP